MNLETFQTIKHTLSQVTFQNKTYYHRKAYVDTDFEDLWQITIMRAWGYTGETDEAGNLILFDIRWAYCEAEDLADCTNWESPYKVVQHY